MPYAGRWVPVVVAGIIASMLAFGGVSAEATDFVDRHDANTKRYQRMHHSASRRDESSEPGGRETASDPARPGKTGIAGQIGSLLRAVLASPRKRAAAGEPADEPGRAVDASRVDRSIMDNVLEFRRSTVDDVMVPRAEIVAVPVTAPLADVLQAFRSAGHSRLPVYSGTLDNPRGMVHIRDMLEYIASNVVRADGEAVDFRRPSVMPDLSVSLQSAGITRPVLFVPASMPVPALLARMKVSRTHMALVIDEYGGTDGLVSLEDLVELVVGDIEDEHDLGVEPEIRRVDERTFLVDARASFEDVFQAIGVPPPGTDLAEEVDTIGGYIMWLTGRLPDVGESIALDDRIEVEVVDADPRRLRRLRIHRQT